MKNISGYLVGLVISVVAAGAVTVGALVYLSALLRGRASLGGDDNPTPVLLLLLGGYLVVAAAVAVVASRRFNSRPVLAFLINVTPLLAIILVTLGVREYKAYASDRDLTRAVQNAIDDAPAMHTGEPYLKKIERPTGGVILFLHVPLKVDRTVRSKSLDYLAGWTEPPTGIRYSSKPECNSGSGVPTYGFHLVDREHTEPLLPSSQSRRTVVSEQLHPGTQYYLLRELHLGSSKCKLSDYEDFDLKQINVFVNDSTARQILEMR